jgi:hypothetical protein
MQNISPSLNSLQYLMDNPTVFLTTVIGSSGDLVGGFLSLIKHGLVPRKYTELVFHHNLEEDTWSVIG